MDLQSQSIFETEGLRWQVIANKKTFAYENAKEVIPGFWQEHYQTGKGKTVMGVFGINIDEKMGNESFEYLIADPYVEGKEVPAGFSVETIPEFTWAVFPCVGPMPNALQDVNAKIFTEWLPALKEYEFAAGYCVEYYDDPTKYTKGTLDDNYYCEIWMPVKSKNIGFLVKNQCVNSNEILTDYFLLNNNN